MRYTTLISALSLASLLALGVYAMHAPGGAAPVSSRDQVLASFDRELAHEPGAAAPVLRESVSDDQLYRMLNTTHWTPETTAVSGDSGTSEIRKGDDHEISQD